MLKPSIRVALLCLTLSLFTGCATRNVPLHSSFWQNSNEKITIVAAQPPTPGVHIVGGQGLLDAAITIAANSKLSSSIEKTDLSWYEELPHDFIKRLKVKQKEVTLYSKKLDLRKKDQAKILAETKDDLLLTFKLRAVGAQREYAAGFVPMGGPKAYCVLVGELVNPKEKRTLWHHEVEIIQKVNGPWDEPPLFPNFNTALNVAITDAKQELMDSFFSGQ